MTAIDLGNGTMITTYNIYAWTNGSREAVARSRTRSLLKLIFEEIARQPVGPVLIFGDLNAEPSDIAPLWEKLEDSSFFDVGHLAHVWGQPGDDYTCLPPRARSGTRLPPWDQPAP